MADAAHPHVVLVGLSGTGKTSIGRLVATRLGTAYVDSDAAIEARAGRSVREIFAEDGEARFRALEAEVLGELLDGAEPTVVAAGGGAVVTASTRARLRAADVFVVWLTADPAFLASRAAGRTHRPLLDDDPVATMTRLAQERDAWFREVADAELPVQPSLAAEPKPVAKARLAAMVDDMVALRRAARTRDHLVLVGAMGVGKSTVGHIVATRSGRPYVDSDDVVQQRTGRTAREVAEADGLHALHELELVVCRDALASSTPTVIGTAASVVDTSTGRLAVATARHVVWLRTDHETVLRRMREGDHRPTVDAATALGRDREYAAVATVIVDEEGLDPGVVADKIMDATR